MRRMTGSMMVLGLLSLGLLCGCDDEYVPGEGARRYGGVRGETATDQAGSDGAVEVAKEAAAVVPVAKKKDKGAAPTPARGSGRRKKGKGGTKYTVLKEGVKDGGTISGTIKLDGTGPHGVAPIRINKEVEKCKHDEHPSERVVMDEETRGLANCLVLIENIKKGKDWPEAMRAKNRTALMDQIQCKYVPHVLVCREKTQLVVRNSDPAEHNINGSFKGTQKFNFLTGVGAKDKAPGAARLTGAGMYTLKCDIHPWMNAMIWTVTNPYFALTDAKGKFEIKDIPPGKYKLYVWHESMKEEPLTVAGEISGYSYGPDFETRKTVEVTAGSTTTADFTVPLP